MFEYEFPYREKSEIAYRIGIYLMGNFVVMNFQLQFTTTLVLLSSMFCFLFFVFCVLCLFYFRICLFPIFRCVLSVHRRVKYQYADSCPNSKLWGFECGMLQVIAAVKNPERCLNHLLYEIWCMIAVEQCRQLKL